MNDTTFQHTSCKRVLPHSSNFYSDAPVCLYPQAAHNALRAQEELTIASRNLAEAKRMLELCDDDTYFQVIGSLGYLRDHVDSARRAVDSIASYNMREYVSAAADDVRP